MKPTTCFRLLWLVAFLSVFELAEASGEVIIALGGLHTCALLSGGEVMCWGRNDFGGLGDGSTTSRSSPVKVSGITTATSIALGDYHTCALLSGGEVMCWGYNNYGQLGDGTTITRSTPVKVVGLYPPLSTPPSPPLPPSPPPPPSPPSFPLPPPSPPPSPPSPPPPSLVIDDYENDTTGLVGVVLVFVMTTLNLLLQL